MQKNICCAALGSRLGLKFAPIRHTELNIGVDDGAAFLSNQLGKFESYYEKSFPDPDDLTSNDYLSQVMREYETVVSQLLDSWKPSQQLVTFGGDHSISFISLQAVLQRFGEKNVGVLLFDSHGDLHLKETSPTGNFHGMWLRAFFDTFTVQKQYTNFLKPEQLQIVGNLQLEQAEADFMRDNEIQVYSSERCTALNAKKLSKWTKEFEHLHISFDIDVFAEKIVSATGTANPNGLSVEQVFCMLEAVVNHPSISLDIVEFNPQKSGATETLCVIKTVYNTVIQSNT